jgi:hypothetical protein
LIYALRGEDFAGTLVSDGLPAVNALDVHGYLRAQCNSHIISRCSEMEAEQTRGAVRFPREVKTLLKDALELGRRRHEISPEVYAQAVREVREALAALAAKDVTHPENLKLAKHLHRHQGSLLRFLDDEAVPPTNNLAERELRGAVVTRKIGGCNRSEPHAHAHAVISSLAQTAHRAGETLTPHVMRWMQPATAGPPGRAASSSPLHLRSNALLHRCVRRQPLSTYSERLALEKPEWGLLGLSSGPSRPSRVGWTRSLAPQR